MRRGEAVAEASVTCVLGHAWQEGRVLCPDCGFGRRTQPAMDDDGHEVAAQTITAVVAMPASRDHEVGAATQRSPDGHWAWDGDEWVPANLTTLPVQAVAAVSAGHAGDEAAVRTLVDPDRVPDYAPEPPPPVPMGGDCSPAGSGPLDDAEGIEGERTGTDGPTFDDLTAMLTLSEDAEVDEAEQQPLVSWALLDEVEVEVRSHPERDPHAERVAEVAATDLVPEAVVPDAVVLNEPEASDTEGPGLSQLERLAQQLADDPLGPDDPDVATEETADPVTLVDATAEPTVAAEPVEPVETDADDAAAAVEVAVDAPADADADADADGDVDADGAGDVDIESAELPEPEAPVAAVDADGTVDADSAVDVAGAEVDTGSVEPDEPDVVHDVPPVGRSRQARRRQRRAAAQRAAALARGVAAESLDADEPETDPVTADPVAADLDTADPDTADPDTADPDSTDLEDTAELEDDDLDHHRRPWESSVARVAVLVIAAAISTDIATGTAPLGHHTHHAAAAVVADATVSRALSQVAVLETRYASEHGVAATSHQALTPGGYATPAGVEVLVAPATGQGYCLVGERTGTRAYQSWSSGQGLVMQGGSAATFGSLAAAEHACPATGSFQTL